MSPTPEDIQADAESRRAVELLRSLDSVRAPASLRHAVEAMVADSAAVDPTIADSTIYDPAAPVPRTDPPATDRPSTTAERASIRHHRRRSPHLGGPRLAGALALAAVAIVAFTLALSSGPPAPTVLEAARPGLRVATRLAPSESPRNLHQLAVSAAGIPYPYWGGSVGWEATGARSDRVGGRTVTTVFYSDRHRQRIGYSIVSGPALPLPAGATVIENGVRFSLPHAPGFTVVTWREAGHTCILTARSVAAPTLMRLAAWERA
jgi:hypothetical protein